MMRQNNETLRVGKYSIQLIDRHKVTILIPPECKIPVPENFGPGGIGQFEELLHYLPVLQHLGGKRYKVVSRHWLSIFIVDEPVDVFPAIVLPAKKDKEKEKAQVALFEDIGKRELNWLGLDGQVISQQTVPTGASKFTVSGAPAESVTLENALPEPVISEIAQPETDTSKDHALSEPVLIQPRDMLAPAQIVTAPSITPVLDISRSEPSETENTEELWDSTSSRKRSKQTGRICPFCGGPLVYSLENPPLHPEFLRTIACSYSTIPKNMCKFSCEITEWEDRKFRDFDFITTDFVKLEPDKKCKCKEAMYHRTICFSDQEKKQEYYCRTRLVAWSGRYSADDFKTLEAKRLKLTIKKLCDVIVKSKLEIEYPQKKYGLPWLNALLANPTLSQALDNRNLKGYMRGDEHLREAIVSIQKNKGDGTKAYAKYEKGVFMLFNRTRIDRNFLGSPRMFQDGFKYCEHSEPKI